MCLVRKEIIQNLNTKPLRNSDFVEQICLIAVILESNDDLMLEQLKIYFTENLFNNIDNLLDNRCKNDSK